MQKQQNLQNKFFKSKKNYLVDKGKNLLPEQIKELSICCYERIEINNQSDK